MGKEKERGGGERKSRKKKKGGSACLVGNGCYSDHTSACQLCRGALLHTAPKWQIKDTPQ